MRVNLIFVLISIFELSILLCFRFSEAYVIINQEAFLDIKSEKPSLGKYESEGSITVNRVKRLDNSLIEEEPFDIKLRAFDKNYDLKLVRPRSSIFTSDFQFQTYDVDHENKFHKLRDVTPTKQEMESIESGHMVNPEQNTAISMNEKSGKIQGIVQDMTITSINGNRTNIVVIKQNEIKNNGSNKAVDYLSTGRTIRKAAKGRTAAGKKVTVVHPEVLVVIDFKMNERYNRNASMITDYTAIMFHGVNNLYSGIRGPRIKFLISGIRIIESRAAQPFLENHKIPDGSGYDVVKNLEDFSRWVFDNSKTLPKHDMAIFVSGEDLQMLNTETGVYGKNVAGLAYLEGACLVNKFEKKSMATGVAEDSGMFGGLMTVTHELAHNLGAPHDGDGKSKSCSWNDGHIMSYLGHGTKSKFSFSSCSIKTMKDYIDSSGAGCLFTNETQPGKGVQISVSNIGRRVTMDDKCKHTSKVDNAVADAKIDGNTLCKNVHCTWTVQDPVIEGKQEKGLYTYTSNLMAGPGDDAQCGVGKMCWNGDCISRLERAFVRI